MKKPFEQLAGCLSLLGCIDRKVPEDYLPEHPGYL